jgi:hypothetical protein
VKFSSHLDGLVREPVDLLYGQALAVKRAEYVSAALCAEVDCKVSL